MLHAQTLRVEVDCSGDVLDGEDDVVDGADGEGGGHVSYAEVLCVLKHVYQSMAIWVVAQARCAH